MSPSQGPHHGQGSDGFNSSVGSEAEVSVDEDPDLNPRPSWLDVIHNRARRASRLKRQHRVLETRYLHHSMRMNQYTEGTFRRQKGKLEC